MIARATLASLGLATGCFQSIAPDQPDAGAPPDGTFAGPFSTLRGADGTYTTRVDATSPTAWTYGDLETGAAAGPDDAWDLRFQRFHISTNGGVSGAGGVAIVPLPGVPFGALDAPPTTGWISDAPDGDDANPDPDYAFEQGDGWYAYDPMTHVLTPRPHAWVVKTTGGALIELAIDRYYDDAGTAGWFLLRWRPL